MAEKTPKAKKYCGNFKWCRMFCKCWHVNKRGIHCLKFWRNILFRSFGRNKPTHFKVWYIWWIVNTFEFIFEISIFNRQKIIFRSVVCTVGTYDMHYEVSWMRSAFFRHYNVIVNNWRQLSPFLFLFCFDILTIKTCFNFWFRYFSVILLLLPTLI